MSIGPAINVIAMLEIATVAMLPRNDISGSAFVNPPVLSFRPRRSRVEESSGLTMVQEFPWDDTAAKENPKPYSGIYAPHI